MTNRKGIIGAGSYSAVTNTACAAVTIHPGLRREQFAHQSLRTSILSQHGRHSFPPSFDSLGELWPRRFFLPSSGCTCEGGWGSLVVGCWVPPELQWSRGTASYTYSSVTKTLLSSKSYHAMVISIWYAFIDNRTKWRLCSSEAGETKHGESERDSESERKEMCRQIAYFCAFSTRTAWIAWTSSDRRQRMTWVFQCFISLEVKKKE